MESTPLLVGLDVGTTNIKAIAFDPAGQAVAQATVPTPTHYHPEPSRQGWAYYHPEELWETTARALRQVTAGLTEPGRVVGVAVASVGETGIPLDRAGRPTGEAIAWFDRRTTEQAAWLDAQIGWERLFAISGLALQPIFGLCKVLWLRQHEPEAWARTARWLNVADYIAYRLSGQMATDFSLASRTLALDLHRLRWATELLAELGLPPDLFAPLTASGTPLGPVLPEVAAATGLPSHAQVAVGGHDHVCGALALGVTDPGTVLNSLGTAEAVFLPVTRPLTDPAFGQQGYSQGTHVDGRHYYALGGLYTSGASVEWFREAIADGAPYATLIQEAADVPPGSLGVCFLPHLRLANPPHLDPRSRGAFIGLSTEARRGVLFRALLEGLSLEMRSTLEPLLGHAQATLQRVMATGGGTRNELWIRIKAGVLDRPVHVVSVAESTALGAAVLAGMGAGVYADVADALARLALTATPVHPVPEEARLYSRIYREVYSHVYETLRPLHHALDTIRSSRSS
ncbi:hypothetical protein FKZ61_000545 [Litorilinea aerophila]|uniref:Carbohydrate kinase n=1 Tax=Litorilinea aerophila TaxID=1204385 RepID=A0A540VMB2_9CHLR|nr:FGGY family carbohydrate kinase [Litorilinea aerophila]MCC9074602.1 hypothetical protein [Litorilinea aerophila]